MGLLLRRRTVRAATVETGALCQVFQTFAFIYCKCKYCAYNKDDPGAGINFVGLFGL